MLRSAVLPGWGQFYNESYWKIPVIWGVAAYFTGSWIRNNNQYKKYRDLYAESTGLNGSGNSSLLNIREFYKDQRDLFAIYLALTYFLNLLDAYVDAHLFDFEVTEDLNGSSKMLNIKVYLP